MTTQKIGRNDPCPCGSGQKYKRCCRTAGGGLAPSQQQVLGIAFDPANNRVFIGAEGAILNQLRLDAPKIARTFDALCMDHLKTVDNIASRVLFCVGVALFDTIREADSLEGSCARLLMNSLSTLTAAVDLLRDGFILQPGILIRNILESLTAVICIFTDEKDFAAFKLGRLRPEAKISTASRVLPNFGELYGFFSAEFAHIRDMHSAIHPIVEYSKFSEPLSTNLNFIRLTTWLLYVVTELVFLDRMKPLYWTNAQPGKYVFAPTSEGEEVRHALLMTSAESTP